MKATLITGCIIPVFFFSSPFPGPKNDLDCSGIKTGVFYSYEKNSSDKYKIIRKSDIQIEYNITKNDSTIFKIKWIGDCTYSLEYLSSSHKWKHDDAQYLILTKHKLIFEVIGIADNYYTANFYLDRVQGGENENRQISTETVWMSEQKGINNMEIFTALSDGDRVLLKKKFKDTSSYAILYLYRPNQSTAMLNEYFVYCDQVFIFWAQNKTRAAYKIRKEGAFDLEAKSGGEESKLRLDIRFGKKYYVECVIHHKDYKATPELKLISGDTGEGNFENIQ